MYDNNGLISVNIYISKAPFRDPKADGSSVGRNVCKSVLVLGDSELVQSFRYIADSRGLPVTWGCYPYCVARFKELRPGILLELWRTISERLPETRLTFFVGVML